MDSGQTSADRALDIETLKTACYIYTEARVLCRICNYKMIKDMCIEIMKNQLIGIEYYTEKLGGYVKNE